MSKPDLEEARQTAPVDALRAAVQPLLPPGAGFVLLLVLPSGAMGCRSNLPPATAIRVMREAADHLEQTEPDVVSIPRE